MALKTSTIPPIFAIGRRNFSDFDIKTSFDNQVGSVMTKAESGKFEGKNFCFWH